MGKSRIFEAELYAVYMGLKICSHMGMERVIVESDAITVIAILNKHCTVANWKVLQVLNQVQAFTQTMEVQFQHIHR